MTGSQRDAPCKGRGELFFSDIEVEIDEAKRMCGLCRFRRDCLQGALDRREACGVWGGELLRDGAVVMFRPRGRPKTQRVVEPV